MGGGRRGRWSRWQAGSGGAYRPLDRHVVEVVPSRGGSEAAADDLSAARARRGPARRWKADGRGGSLGPAMGGGRRGRWSRWQAGSGGAYRPLDRYVVEVVPSHGGSEPIGWRLPPSKSHLIRWLALAAQSTSAVQLSGVAGAGADAASMARMVRQLGVQVETGHSAWVVHGVGPGGLRRPVSLLHAANSGAALRLVAALVARLGSGETAGPIMLDGDQTLRRRGLGALREALEALGVEVRVDAGPWHLPALVQGPWTGGSVSLDAGASSQPLSALVLASPGLPEPLQVQLMGEAVSRRHAALSASLATQAGWTGALVEDGTEVLLEPWSPEPPAEVHIPPDASHLAFAALTAACSGRPVTVHRWPQAEDAIGAEVVWERAAELGLEVGLDGRGGTLSWRGGAGAVELDLRDANDLLPPLAALLALGGGGRLTGVAHARHKESDRLSATAGMMRCFGLDAAAGDGELVVEAAGQVVRPDAVVDSHGDHRIQMTAVLLGLVAGATVDGSSLHAVSDPAFLDQLQSTGEDVVRRTMASQPSRPK